jgi:hypothetical protein
MSTCAGNELGEVLSPSQGQYVSELPREVVIPLSQRVYRASNWFDVARNGVSCDGGG